MRHKANRAINVDIWYHSAAMQGSKLLVNYGCFSLRLLSIETVNLLSVLASS